MGEREGEVETAHSTCMGEDVAADFSSSNSDKISDTRKSVSKKKSRKVCNTGRVQEWCRGEM